MNDMSKDAYLERFLDHLSGFLWEGCFKMSDNLSVNQVKTITGTCSSSGCRS